MARQHMVPEGVEVVRNVPVLVIYYVNIRHMIVGNHLSMHLVHSIKYPGRKFLWFSLVRKVHQFVNRGIL